MLSGHVFLGGPGDVRELILVWSALVLTVALCTHMSQAEISDGCDPIQSLHLGLYDPELILTSR